MHADLIRDVWRWSLAGCLCWSLIGFGETARAQTSSAEDGLFQVEQVTTELRDGVYLVDANMRLELSEPVKEALTNGVPLYISIDLRVVRERAWWVDETLAEVSQRYRLEYFDLSQQYLVVNLNTEVRELFHDIDTALAYIGLLVDFPLLDRVLVTDSSRYLGEIRARLDLGRLPLPLLPNAYFASDWDLVSPWFQWLLK